MNFCLEELGRVDDDAEEEDWEDVVPGLPVLRRQVERVADAQEPLDGDGHGHEDGPAQADVGDRVDDEGEADVVRVAARLERLEGVVDAAYDDVSGVEAGQGDQQLVKTVLQLGLGQNKDGEQVAWQ